MKQRVKNLAAAAAGASRIAWAAAQMPVLKGIARRFERLKLAAMALSIDALTAQQRAYGASWTGGDVNSRIRVHGSLDARNLSMRRDLQPTLCSER